MRAIAGERNREPILALAVVVAALSIMTLGVLEQAPVRKIGPIVAVIVVVAATHRWLLRWRNLIIWTILVILFIPIRRYTLPGSLPFQLEPYRVLIALVAVGWMASLLVDPRVRLRRTGFEGPLGLLLLVIAVSLLLNPSRVRAVSPVLTKSLMFFISYLVVLLIIVSVVRRAGDVDVLCKVLVAGGAVVALAAIVESRTGFNVFDHLQRVFPILNRGPLPFQGHDLTGVSRGGTLRAYASAQHPIALGAALTMLVPLGVYLAVKLRSRGWWVATALLVFGEFATVSRTGFLMLVAVAVVFAALRFQDVRRFWPAIIPAVIVLHFAVPGTIGSVVEAFFPEGGLIAQQSDQNVGSGRLATLGPVLHKEFLPNPIFGEGFGTRIVTNDTVVPQNSAILDDEWGGILAEVGVLGAFAFLWVFSRAIRRLIRAARADRTTQGLLPVALAASILSFGVGMFTFDAFSFIQVTFLFYIMLGLTAVVLTVSGDHGVAGRIGGRRVAMPRLRPSPQHHRGD